MTTDAGTVTDQVHGREAASGWTWRKPRRGEFFRTCSWCGSVHPQDVADLLVPAGDCKICGGDGYEGHYRKTLAPVVRTAIASGTISAADLPEDERRRLAVPEHPYGPGGAYPSWADQKYGWPHKFYIYDLLSREPGLLRYLGSSTSGPGEWGGPDAVWVQDREMSRQQRAILVADGALGAKDKPDGTWYCLAPKATLHAKFYTAHLADPLLPDGAKEKIYAASGLRFHFGDDGRVSWHGAGYSCEEVHPAS